jgi:preprotein translocase subunit SecF
MRIFETVNFNFIRWRWHAVALSCLVIGAGIATIVARGGLPLGIDFSGGTVVVLGFERPVGEEEIRQALGPLRDQAVVQRYGTDTSRNEMMIRLPQAADQESNLDRDAVRVEEALRSGNVGNFSRVSREFVGPTIGHDLQRKGIWATLTALGGILLYIGIRFRFSFAVGAVVATFHDIAVTLAFLTWFGYDVSLNVIAAILAIAGYSVNDTIVVFDRVRENQRMVRREPLEAVVNRSVNQTLSRTIITAGTTFLAVLSLYLFGGEVLRGFAFSMLVGIIAGTYSTVFIASAIAILFSRQSAARVTQNAKPAEARRKRA